MRRAGAGPKYRPITVFSLCGTPLGWKWVCIRKSEPLGSGIATPCGRKAGVVPGTHPPSPPLSALSGSPTVKMEPKPGNPGWPSTAILLARAAGGVGEEQRVMDHASRGGLQLDGADPFVGGEVGGDDEVAVDVGAVGGHGKGGGHFQNQVGRAELPGIGVLRHERRFGRIAQRHTSVHPLLDERDLVGGEAALIAIRGPAGLGLPGRHVARLRDGGDGRARGRARRRKSGGRTAPPGRDGGTWCSCRR